MKTYNMLYENILTFQNVSSEQIIDEGAFLNALKKFWNFLFNRKSKNTKKYWDDCNTFYDTGSYRSHETYIEEPIATNNHNSKTTKLIKTKFTKYIDFNDIPESEKEDKTGIEYLKEIIKNSNNSLENFKELFNKKNVNEIFPGVSDNDINIGFIFYNDELTPIPVAAIAWGHPSEEYRKDKNEESYLDYAHIYCVDIVSIAKGNNLDKILLTGVIDKIKEKKYKGVTIQLKTTEQVNLYKKFGFKEFEAKTHRMKFTL